MKLLDDLSITWKRTFSFICAISTFNFILFVVMTFILGGDAINGKAQNGKYFLAMKGHYTEVSETIFLYSKYHAISVLVSFILILGAAWFRYKHTK